MILSVFLSMRTAHAQNPYVVSGTPAWQEGLNIAENAVFFVDKTPEALTVNEVENQKFLPFNQKRNERTSESEVTIIRTWVRFKIKNISQTDTARLHLLTGGHHEIALYQAGRPIAKAGLNFSATHNIPASGYMPFMVPPDSTLTYYFRVTDYVISVTPVFVILHTAQTAVYNMAKTLMQEQVLFLLMSIFVGCLLFMAFYSIYHFWLTRDSIFAWYSLYVTTAAEIALTGLEDRFQLPLLHKLLTVPFGENNGQVTIAFAYLLPAFYIIFISKITGIPKQLPRTWLILKTLVCILVAQQVLGIYQIFTGNLFYSNTYYQHALLSLPISTLVLLYGTIRSQSPVKYYLIAGLGFFIFLIFAPLYINFFAEDLYRYPELEAIINLPMFWVFLGLTLEALCFSFALAYRNKLVETEKNQLQVQYAGDLEQQLEQRTNEVRAQSMALENQRVRQLQNDFEQKLAETEMTALRAQMNPHFIFNCLNSIKLYTLKNDPATAANYLTRFSRLIRLVLENSRSEKVTLADELEILEIYLEMEAMRFKNKVKYQIEVSENIDAQYIEIPPLLLQPYVENAIWHGLMHKKAGGKVEIKVELLDEETLQISISDDGVGRAEASKLKSKSATRDKSFGMKMTSERISLINQLYKSKTNVKIEDLVDSEGIPAGTRVVIAIPV